MSKILKDFYYGNLSPSERRGPNHKAIGNLLRLTERNREQLYQSLNAEQKEILEKYENGLNEIHALASEDCFVNGFCLGTRMTAEAFADD